MIGLRLPLAATDDPPQWLHSLPQIIREVCAPLGCVAGTFFNIADAIFRFLSPIFQCFPGIVVASFQVTTELLASFRRKREGHQSSRSESNQQECDRGSYAVTFRRFITSSAHN